MSALAVAIASSVIGDNYTKLFVIGSSVLSHRQRGQLLLGSGAEEVVEGHFGLDRSPVSRMGESVGCNHSQMHCGACLGHICKRARFAPQLPVVVAVPWETPSSSTPTTSTTCKAYCGQVSGSIQKHPTPEFARHFSTHPFRKTKRFWSLPIFHPASCSGTPTADKIRSTNVSLGFATLGHSSFAFNLDSSVESHSSQIIWPYPRKHLAEKRATRPRP